MLTMNRATLVGHAGRNPEMRTLPSGDEVALFSLATTERFRRRDGTEGESTEWHAIVAFGTAAQIVRKLVHRGAAVLVEGRIATRTWTDRTGTDHRTSEILVSGPQARVNVLTKRSRGPGGGDEPPGGGAPAGAAKPVEPDRNDESAEAAAVPASAGAADAGTGDDADAGSRADGEVAAGSGGPDAVQTDEGGGAADEGAGHGGGNATTGGPPEAAASAQAAPAGREAGKTASGDAAAGTTGKPGSSEAERSADGTSGGVAAEIGKADAGTETGASGRSGDADHE